MKGIGINRDLKKMFEHNILITLQIPGEKLEFLVACMYTKQTCSMRRTETCVNVKLFTFTYF